MKRDYAKEVRRVGIGGTPQICQDALIEVLENLFAGKKFTGQEGRKELKIIKQSLTIPKRQRDRKADTDEATAPYVLVEMNEGAILDDDSPQIVEFSPLVRQSHRLRRMKRNIAPASARTRCITTFTGETFFLS